MKFGPFFLPISCVYGSAIHKGVLYFHDLEENQRSHGLGAEDGKVVADDRIAYIMYYKSGALMFDEEEKYVYINQEGKLVLSKYPHAGFFLKEEPGSFWKMRLSFDGDDIFQLCGDNLIGFESKCEGARSIRLDYELCWPFQSEESIWFFFFFLAYKVTFESVFLMLNKVATALREIITIF